MIVMELKCSNGILKIYEDRVVISRKTLTGFAIQGLKGDRTFFYKNINGVEYKKPTMWANGYIKFITAGTTETNHKAGFLGTTRWETLEDENAVILRAFRKEVPQMAEKIYEYIMKKIGESTEKNSNLKSENNSVADEILKFKKLADEGIISEEEFEKKKKELLK